MATTTSISLKTHDGVVFEVESSIAKNMKTIQTFIDETTTVSDSAIPLPNVLSNHLTMIIEYFRLSDAGKAKEFSVNDLDNEELKVFLLAVHYLNIDSLFEVLTQAVADRIEKRSVGYVRKYFGIENDLTVEEEAEIRMKNDWAFRGDDIEPEPEFKPELKTETKPEFKPKPEPESKP